MSFSLYGILEFDSQLWHTTLLQHVAQLWHSISVRSAKRILPSVAKLLHRTWAPDRIVSKLIISFYTSPRHLRNGHGWVVSPLDTTVGGGDASETLKAHGWQWFFCCCFALSLLTDWLISSWRSRYHLDATESEMLQGDFMNQDNCSQVIWPEYICLAFNLPSGVSVSNNIDRADVWQNNEQWLLQQFWHQIFS